MRKLDLTGYAVQVLTEDGMKSIPFETGEMLALIMYHPDLRLSARDLMENDRVAQKINSAHGSVLLEEAEYQRVKSAIEIIRGFTKADVEMVKRVLEAPEIPVKEVERG